MIRRIRWSRAWTYIEKRVYRAMGRRAPWDYTCPCCYRQEIPQIRISLTPLELMALESLLAPRRDLEPLFEGWDNPNLDQDYETALDEADEIITKAIIDWSNK